MHGYAIEFAIDRAEQANDFYLRILQQFMKRPCAIFTAAPGHQCFLFYHCSHLSHMADTTSCPIIRDGVPYSMRQLNGIHTQASSDYWPLRQSI